MRICPACARENPDDRDFCECGEYLNWELTGIHTPVEELPTEPLAPAELPAPPVGAPVELPAPPPPPPPLARPAPSGAHWTGLIPVTPREETVTIVLRLPDGEPANEDVLRQRVAAGGDERVLALVRNRSGIVDNYDLVVGGLPEGWWSIHPGTLYLTPFGSGGTYEQEVEVHLHPPRGAEAQARTWNLSVAAYSRSQDELAASAPLALDIEPFVDVATTLRPQRKKGRRKADFAVTVVNRANAPVLVALEGEDADGELRFGFDAPPAEIPPGGSATTRMRVTPPKPIWIGRAVERRFEARTLTGTEAHTRAATAPRKPGFFPQVTPPSAQLGPGGLQLRGPQMAPPRLELRMPRGSAAAPPPPQAPLTPTQGIFRQRPLIPWWAPIVLALLVIAALALFLLLPKHATVPKVTGAPSAFEAEKTLTAAHLKLGDQKTKVDPHPPGSVIDQTPKPGARVDKGSAVSVLVAVSSDRATVPNVVGLTAADADAALQRRGLTLGQASPQPIDPAAKIADQIPAAGAHVKAGTPVMIFYKAAPTPTPTPSATPSPSPTATATHTGGEVTVPPPVSPSGAPELAFSDGKNIRMVDTGTGKPLGSVAAGPLQETDPTFAPDGKRIAYVADGQVFLRELGKRSAATPLTGPGQQFANLAWAPKGDLIAMDRVDGAGSSLCLMTVGEPPLCKPQPDFDVALAMHWAPDGKSLFATGKSRDGHSPGIVEWDTDTAFAPDPGAWGDGHFVTDINTPGKGVVDAVISPDGQRMAVITNFTTSDYRLWMTVPGDFSLAQATPTGLRACKVAWRGDSQDVAITEADDTCEEGRGPLSQLNPDDPNALDRLAAQANDPTYQPQP